MNILSIESSSQILSVALNRDDETLNQFKSKGKFKSEHIISLIKKSLSKAKLALQDLDYIAVDLGPGSFTGLRVGIAAAKALSLVYKIKIIGVASLDCISANIKSRADKDICVIIDARRSNLYCAIFRQTSNFKLTKTLSYSLLNLSQLLKKVKSPCIFVGDGLLNFQEAIRREKPNLAFFAPRSKWYPEASRLAKLSYEAIKNNKAATENILPIYLYPKECQIKP